MIKLFGFPCYLESRSHTVLQVLYPYFESFFPGVTAAAQHEHEDHHEQLKAIEALFEGFEKANGEEM